MRRSLKILAIFEIFVLLSATNCLPRLSSTQQPFNRRLQSWNGPLHLNFEKARYQIFSKNFANSFEVSNEASSSSRGQGSSSLTIGPAGAHAKGNGASGGEAATETRGASRGWVDALSSFGGKGSSSFGGKGSSSFGGKGLNSFGGKGSNSLKESFDSFGAFTRGNIGSAAREGSIDKARNQIFGNFFNGRDPRKEFESFFARKDLLGQGRILSSVGPRPERRRRLQVGLMGGKAGQIKTVLVLRPEVREPAKGSSLVGIQTSVLERQSDPLRGISLLDQKQTTIEKHVDPLKGFQSLLSQGTQSASPHSVQIERASDPLARPELLGPIGGGSIEKSVDLLKGPPLLGGENLGGNARKLQTNGRN